MERLSRGMQELRASTAWRDLLAATLGIGNYINHGSVCLGAKGITMESMLQMREFKGAAGVTALHCMCAMLRSKDICFCQKLLLELQGIPEAARVNIACMRESMDRLHEELKLAIREVFEHSDAYAEKPVSSSQTTCVNPGIPCTASKRGQWRQDRLLLPRASVDMDCICPSCPAMTSINGCPYILRKALRGSSTRTSSST
eukprot:3048993-Amphidinium_carterae.1